MKRCLEASPETEHLRSDNNIAANSVPTHATVLRGESQGLSRPSGPLPPMGTESGGR